MVSQIVVILAVLATVECDVFPTSYCPYDSYLETSTGNCIKRDFDYEEYDNEHEIIGFKVLDTSSFRKLILSNLIPSNTTELQAENFKNLSFNKLYINYKKANKLGNPEADFLEPLQTTLNELVVNNIHLPPMPAASIIKNGDFRNGVSNGSFGGCTELTKLNLHNWTIHSENWLTSCSNLTDLTMKLMSSEGIERVLGQVMGFKLQALDLSYNPDYDICHLNISFPSLKKLDLSYTRSNIKCLSTRNLPSLQILHLKRKNITTLLFQDLLMLPVPIKIDLDFNPINDVIFTEVDYEKISNLYIAKNITSPTVIKLYGSIMLECDCRNGIFAKALRQQFISTNNARCTYEKHLYLEEKSEKLKKLEDVPQSKLECDKFSCDRCTCRQSWNDSTTFADCSYGRATNCGGLEFSINNLTQLNASNSRLKEINEINVPESLKILDLINNNISHINEAVTSKLFSLKDRKLFLSGNPIKCNCENEHLIRVMQLHPDQVVDYQKLTCFIESNQTLISKVEANELCTTELTNLTEDVAKKLFYVKERRLRLTGDGIGCNCENKPIIGLIQIHQEQILNYKQLTCFSESNRTLLARVNVSELCVTVRTQYTISDSRVLISYILSGVLVMLACLAILIQCLYGQTIRIYMYARGWCMCCVREDELDADKQYDAFVAYCHEDHHLVSEEFVPKLEKEGFRVCIHYKNWIPGELIPTQMASSVESSRRTIVFLSKSFVESLWGMLEFRTAHAKANQEGIRRLILIVLDDVINNEKLDIDLRSYIRTNTYLCWEDPWFWDKIRYAMPKPHTDVNHRIATSEAPEIVIQSTTKVLLNKTD